MTKEKRKKESGGFVRMAEGETSRLRDEKLARSLVRSFRGSFLSAFALFTFSRLSRLATILSSDFYDFNFSTSSRLDI